MPFDGPFGKPNYDEFWTDEKVYKNGPLTAFQINAKNGKLHGLVQIYGQQTVNPKGHCSHIIFQGISFVGWYENGKPTGRNGPTLTQFT